MSHGARGLVSCGAGVLPIHTPATCLAGARGGEIESNSELRPEAKKRNDEATYLAGARGLVSHLGGGVVASRVHLLALFRRRSLSAEVARAGVARRLICSAADAIEGCRAHAAAALWRPYAAEVARRCIARRLLRCGFRSDIHSRATGVSSACAWMDTRWILDLGFRV